MKHDEIGTSIAHMPDIADPDGPPLLLNQLWEKLSKSTTPFSIYTPAGCQTWTFDQIGQDVAKVLAWVRQELELPKGGAIGIQTQNSREWIVLDLACVIGGYPVYPFDAHQPLEINETISTFDLVAFFGPATDPDATVCFTLTDIADVIQDTRRAADMDGLRPVALKRDDIVSAKFTSGTTSKPKVMAAKAINVENSMRNVQRLMHHSPSDLILVFLPLSLLQQRMWIYSAILFDVPIVVTTPMFSLAALKDMSPTVVMGVPDFFETLRRAYTSQSVSDENPQTLKDFLGGKIRYLWTGSAPASSDILTFYDRHNVALLQGYGMNEACIVTKNGPDTNRLGSSGQVMANYRISFDADAQIIIHPACEVNTTYLNGACGDPQTFGPNGEIYTGDIGYLDDDGFLYVTGRIKEMIPLSNGLNLDPKPLEAHLLQQPGISGAIVVGAGRPFCLGLVTVDDTFDTTIDVEHLSKHINAELAPRDRLGKLVVLRDQFTPENGMLTSQYKLKRRAIEARYKDIIMTAYGDAL